MRLRLDYPGLSAEAGAPIFEHVSANIRMEDAYLPHWTKTESVAELREHSVFIPLAPGDIVAFDARTFAPTRIIHPTPVWTLDVDFALPHNLVTGQVLSDEDPAMKIIKRVTGEWQREAWVTQHTGFSFFVSAPDRDWLENRVILSEYVDHVRLIRYPDMEIDLKVAIDNADFEDLTIGPWS